MISPPFECLDLYSENLAKLEYLGTIFTLASLAPHIAMSMPDNIEVTYTLYSKGFKASHYL